MSDTCFLGGNQVPLDLDEHVRVLFEQYGVGFIEYLAHASLFVLRVHLRLCVFATLWLRMQKADCESI